MKKLIMMAVMAAMSVSAMAMSYTQAREEALFLSDKMAYELNLTMEQYEAVYEINLDYLMSINVKGDIRGLYWDRRNTDLRFVLDVYQYARYKASAYFYRPVYWKNSSLIFRIYERYVNRNVFYHNRPVAYVNYRGGYSSRPVSHYSDKPQAHLGSKLPIVNGAQRYSVPSTTNGKVKNTVANSKGGNAQPAAPTRSIGGNQGNTQNRQPANGGGNAGASKPRSSFGGHK